jgi:hypothetical protein
MKNETLINRLKKLNSAETDTVWAIIKYKGEIGIYRKVLAICSSLGLNPEVVIPDLPQDENGRILDRETRWLICDVLNPKTEKVDAKIHN